MKNFPTKSQLLLNFLSCVNWEERYMYIIELGKLLPIFPKNICKEKFLISGCQSQTWIALIIPTFIGEIKEHTHSIKLYGDSDSSIVKGLITIIFSLYQGLTPQAIINLNVNPFLEQLQLKQNLTISRSQGIYTILKSIHLQAKKLKQKPLKIFN